MCLLFFFFKQRTAYEMRISDWSSDVCASDLRLRSRALLDNCLQGSLPILRDWRDSWRWIGGGRGDGGLSNWCRRRAGGLVLGRVDEDNEQKRSEESRVGKECVSTCRCTLSV